MFPNLPNGSFLIRTMPASVRTFLGIKQDYSHTEQLTNVLVLICAQQKLASFLFLLSFPCLIQCHIYLVRMYFVPMSQALF